ncbi:MAG: hypothetical protein AB1767_06110 [Bacillota bacterium]
MLKKKTVKKCHYSGSCRLRARSPVLVFPMTVIVLLVVILSALPAEPCWVHFSTEELVEQADLIVIGEIKGISGTEQVEGMWMTFWRVEAHYYLRGKHNDAALTVATPGARNKQPAISTYYRLNEWGNTVLLFLVRRDGRLEPLSPQGVVALDQNDTEPPGWLTGAYLIQKYTIAGQQRAEEEKSELESYIAGLPRVIAASPGTGSENEGGLRAGRYLFPAVLLCLALAVLVILFRSAIKNKGL